MPISSSTYNNVRCYEYAIYLFYACVAVLLDTCVLFLLLNIVLSLYRELFYEKRNLCSQFLISNPIERLDRHTHQHSHTQKWCAHDPDRLMEVMSPL